MSCSTAQCGRMPPSMSDMREVSRRRWMLAATKRGPEASGGKICITCKVWQPFSEYWKHSGGRFGLRPQCKQCLRDNQKRWSKTPHGKRSIHKSRIASIYGLSTTAYDAMFLAQGGLCWICRQCPKGRLVIDHDHRTHIVRGLLCRRCNVGIANFDEDSDSLRRAIEYLSQTPDAAMDLREIDAKLEDRKT